MRLFIEGGPMMYLLALLALAALGTAIAHVALRGEATRIVAFGLAAILLAAGALTTWRARVHLEKALEYANPADVEPIRAEGLQETAIPLRFGGAAAVICGAVAAVGELVGRRRRG